LLQASAPDPLDYADVKERARRLVEQEKFVQAEPLAERLIAAYPVDGGNWLLAARVKRKLGKYDEAARVYRRASEALGPGVPGNAEYWEAASLAAAGEKARALDVLSHLVESDRYVHRPSLRDDDAFKGLRDDARFRAISGAVDASGWNRNEGWTRDLDYLVAEVVRVNPDYHDRPLPRAFRAQYEELRAQIPRLGDEQIYVGMSRMLAALNQGHVNLWSFLPATRMTFTALPLQFHAFPEGIYVVAADAANADLVGAKLESIENTTALDALARIRAIHARDSGMEVLWYGPALLASAQELKGLGIAPRTDRIALTLRLPSGVVASRTLTPAAARMSTKLHAAPGHAPPRAFADVDRAHWFAPLPEAHGLYVQVNQIADDADETLAAFGKRLRGALADSAIRNVVLDLRHDNGGNTFFYVELLRTLIAFSAGDSRTLYVVIGRGVYSAAANLATDIERLAAPVFVGEPTSMTGNNYGDESELVLPYSGIHGGVTGLRWQLGYPTDLRRAIVPQVPVALTAAAYFAGRDPVLETIVALCRRDGERDD
jgi:tetratricopeptide (TPR) repeat protein